MQKGKVKSLGEPRHLNESKEERDSELATNESERKSRKDISDTESSTEKEELNWKCEKPLHGLNTKNARGTKEIGLLRQQRPQIVKWN